jgi:hypothetical protein
MNYDQSVVEFLAQPDNFAVAVEVAARIEKVRDHLQIRYWNEYRDEMRRRLQDGGLASHWDVTLSSKEMLLKRWANCKLTYRSPMQQPLYLNVGLESALSRSDFRLHYGLVWSQEVQQPLDGGIPADLLQALQALKCPLDATGYWLTYVEVDYRTRDDDFLLRIANDSGTLVNEIADIVWRFFTTIRAPLEAANVALASMTTTAGRA